MRLRPFITLLPALLLAGCASSPSIQPVEQVDIPRFMGSWYVIAHVPGPLDRDPYNAVEHYERRADGRIATTYRQRPGGFDAPVKTMHPLGRVRAGHGNAVWDMRVVWPIQSEYVVVALAPDYSDTVVARSRRDYAWIMARTPTLPPARYDALVAKLAALGYDTTRLRRVPQRWPEARAAESGIR